LPNNSVFIEKKAQKQLLKLPQELQERVSNAIDTLQDEGFSSSLDIKRLKGLGNRYRIRVGNYRILFELSKNHVIIVYAILPRETAYSKI
jgi:Cytotoxic translational repressor of toxin-antitoxin stability system